MDLHFQRIIDHANGVDGQDRRVLDFNHVRDDSVSSQSIVGSGPRHLQEHAGTPTFRRTYPLSRSQSSVQAPTLGPSRISLTSRNIYNRQDDESRIINNTENHFKFQQSLRQGVPMAHAASRLPNMPQADRIPEQNNVFVRQNNAAMNSPISQLADAMLMGKVIPRDQELRDSFRGFNGSRLGQLPQKQQITPPFNFSGLTYSPSSQQAPMSSSPTQMSSPTAKISQRRRSSIRSYSEDFGEENNIYQHMQSPQTPQGDLPWLRTKRNITQTLELTHAPPIAHGIQLISPHELPDRLRHVFPYELFNAVQSKCFLSVYKSNDNVVVSAPTGSGKTAILELAICKLAETQRSGEFKIVYQAPTKSLCSERLRDWQKKFSHLNLPCAELTGDTGPHEIARVRNASIIVTTPEKWDSITRKWADHAKLVQMVKLFLIDEVHILKDTRGATLEAVVSRMKSMGADVRFIALSATVPNSCDIALWLGKDPTNEHLPAHRETFGEDFRPVKLQKHVHGFDGQMNDFAFEKILDGKLPNLIQKYTQKKPILVFCFTRKSCENTAMLLAEFWTRQGDLGRPWPAPAQKPVVGSSQLRELVSCGVAFHHAGLDSQDRHVIETGYLDGDINVICCTSTLAVGVNLPCHLVVLKGTVGYQDGVLGEYSDLEVMQMLGRAGRPQFDVSGIAIIMTRSETVDRYKKMISGQEILESTFHQNLIEHLNSEVWLGTVKNLESAKRWLNGTFLSVRLRQNPLHYKFDGLESTRDADRMLELVCEKGLSLLQENKLISAGELFRGTEYGEAMSRYMVAFETMKLLLSIPAQSTTEQILQTICQATEFKDLRMKPRERPQLREFNKSPLLKYPLKGTISTTAHKILLMVQVQLGGIELPTSKDFNILQRQFNIDKRIIFERIQRIIRCVVDCKIFDCDAVSTKHALDLGRSLSAEYWENSNLQLRQIPQVGPAAVRKFAAGGINSIADLAKKDTGDIERIMSKNPPFGRKILDHLVGFPRLRLVITEVGRALIKTGANPIVNVEASISYENDRLPIWMGKKPPLTFMAETSSGVLAHVWRGSILKLEKGHTVKFGANLAAPGDEINCHIACDDIVGTMTSKVLKPDIPASAFPLILMKKTEVLGLSSKKRDCSDDEFNEDGIGDEELIAAVKDVEATPSDYGSDGFVDIEDLEPDRVSKKPLAQFDIEDTESTQMANGKWTCKHACRDGNMLKNGQACKHRCCHEGLDKPRKSKKRVLGLRPAIESHSGKDKRLFKKLKTKNDKSPIRLRKSAHHKSELDSVDLIDLVDELPAPLSVNSDFFGRRCTSANEGKTSRPKNQNPQFSYDSGKDSDLEFSHIGFQSDDSLNADEMAEDDGLPSPSRLFTKRDESQPAFTPVTSDVHMSVSRSSIFDEPIEDFEAKMMCITEPEYVRPHSPKDISTFAKEIFDFDAFPTNVFESENTQEHEDKARKENSETNASFGGFMETSTQSRCSTSSFFDEKPQRETTNYPNDNDVPIISSVTPSWVDEFDSELIDGLKGFVDFVE